MRGKVDRVKTDDELYGYKPLVEITDRRLNVNNLLRRIKEQKKEDKKFNLLIFSGATSTVLIILMLVSF